MSSHSSGIPAKKSLPGLLPATDWSRRGQTACSAPSSAPRAYSWTKRKEDDDDDGTAGALVPVG
jgi:hypothetical protein